MNILAKTFDRKDAKTQALLDGIQFIFSGKIFLASLTFPWIRFVFPSLTGYNRRLALLDSLRELYTSTIEEHEKDLQEDNPRDLIDVYLTQMKISSDPEFSKEQLKMILFDLFGAGSDTSSSTLCWALLYLTLYQDVQEKCHQEVSSVLGDSDLSLEHSQELNYCQAVLAEVQRHGQVAVTSVMHRLTVQVYIVN